MSHQSDSAMEKADVIAECVGWVVLSGKGDINAVVKTLAAPSLKFWPPFCFLFGKD